MPDPNDPYAGLTDEELDAKQKEMDSAVNKIMDPQGKDDLYGGYIQKQKDDAAKAQEQAFKESIKGPVLGSYHPYGGSNMGSEQFNNEAAVAHRRAQQLEETGYGLMNRQAADIDYAGKIAADRGSIYGSLNTDYKNAIALAKAAAEGTAPSVAAIQQKQGVEDAMRAQATMAASAGGSPFAQAAAMQNAQANAGAQATRAVGDAAALRAQEMAQARGQYGSITDAYTSQLQNLRAQEIGMGVSRAGLMQKQQEINDKGALGFLGLRQQGDVAQAQLQQSALQMEMARQGYGNEQAMKFLTAGLGAASGVAGGWMQMANSSQPPPEPPKPSGFSSDIRGKENIDFANDPMGGRAQRIGPARQLGIPDFSQPTGSVAKGGESDMSNFANHGQDIMSGRAQVSPAEQAAYDQDERERRGMRRFGQDLMMGGFDTMSKSLSAPSQYLPRLNSDIRGKENIEPANKLGRFDKGMSKLADAYLAGRNDVAHENLHDSRISFAPTAGLEGRRTIGSVSDWDQYGRPRGDIIRELDSAGFSPSREEMVRKDMVVPREPNMSRPEQNMSPIHAFNQAAKESAAVYNYRKPELEPRSKPTGGKYAGLMAQRVEKVPQIGEQLVSHTPNGLAFERDAALSATMAGLGVQQKQIDDQQAALDAAQARIAEMEQSTEKLRKRTPIAEAYDAMRPAIRERSR